MIITIPYPSRSDVVLRGRRNPETLHIWRCAEAVLPELENVAANQVVSIDARDENFVADRWRNREHERLVLNLFQVEGRSGLFRRVGEIGDLTDRPFLRSLYSIAQPDDKVDYDLVLNDYPDIKEIVQDHSREQEADLQVALTKLCVVGEHVYAPALEPRIVVSLAGQKRKLVSFRLDTRSHSPEFNTFRLDGFAEALTFAEVAGEASAEEIEVIRGMFDIRVSESADLRYDPLASAVWAAGNTLVSSIEGILARLETPKILAWAQLRDNWKQWTAQGDASIYSILPELETAYNLFQDETTVVRYGATVEVARVIEKCRRFLEEEGTPDLDIIASPGAF